MATIEQNVSGTLLFARNGANRPLHQDRQVLRASDLMLEQMTQDQMLARARRYLHGWGVVAGFAPAVLKSQILQIGPGYGVTPLGDELFLPEKVTLEDAAKVVARCCGPGPAGCDQIDPKMHDTSLPPVPPIAVAGWLIARPASRDASPRSGVPEDCAHPASKLLPSRRCGGVEFAVICSLPPTHQPRQLACDELMPFVCGTDSTGHPPLPWETPLGADGNFLVIAKLTVTADGLTATTEARRTLWPVSLIQDWIESCICPLLARSRPELTVPGGGPGVVTDTPGKIVVDPPQVVATPPVVPPDPIPVATPPVVPSGPIPVATPPVSPSGPIPPEQMVDIRNKLGGPVSEIAGVGAARSAALATIGVNTLGDFITAPTDTLATAMNLPTDRVTAMKQDLSTKHNLGLTFR